MIDEKKLIKELIEKGKKYDEDCGYWERKGEQGNRLICAGKCVGIVQAIEIVENQQKIGEWIPCSERLPEIRQDCLVTVRYTGFMGMHGIWIKTGHMEGKNDWWGDCAGGEVIAWRPLPEPYREGQEAKKRTNADRIRNMTDEELADFIKLKQLFALTRYRTDGKEYTLNWLQSEVEE